MRGRCAVLALACLLLTGCSGLPYPREMGDMALLRTMGVDREEDGLGVTVSTGPRARGLQGEQEGAMVLSALRPSLSSAVLALQSLSDSYVFFGYVDQLLLGEGLTRDGVIPVLDYFSRDVELGLGAQVWVIRDASARQAVESGGEQGVESRLSTLRTDGETGVAAISRTAGEVYSDLLEQGSCYLPALVLSGPDGTTLMEGGYAVVKDGVLAGFLEGDGARGLELLAGKPSADVLEVELPQGLATVRVSKAVTLCSLGAEGQLELTCRVTAHLVERPERLETGQLEELARELEARERRRMETALEQLRAWGCDCLGLGARAGLSAPGQWARLEPEWEETFSRLAPTLEVRAEVHG